METMLRLIVSIVIGARTSHGLSRLALVSPAYPQAYDEALTILALTGHANREFPLLWLNASSQAPAMTVPVMWSYPEADQHWLAYLAQEKAINFRRISDASLCSVLQEVKAMKTDVVRGIVTYEESPNVNALPFLAVTAAGLLDALPVSEALRLRSPCLQQMPVLLQIPAASTFSSDLAAYQWGVAHLLANTSKRMQVGACRSWQNYSCGWSDPLGTAAIDVGVAERAFVHNLSPDAQTNPEQATMFASILSHLSEGSIFIGWAEPESSMIALLSQQGTLQLCGAPNLAFFRILGGVSKRLPYQRSQRQLDRSKNYLIFQSNEGDTPKNAYSFREGNWLSRTRGVIPIAWGVDPLIAEFFPGLWNYYVETASSTDQFFAATGGLGYTYPWSLPHKTNFFQRAGRAWARFMPSQNNWVDLWEGGLNKSLYQEFRRISNNTVDGFSQQASGSAVNTWLEDGTPLFLPDQSLWYPEDKGFCNKSLPSSSLSDCVESLVQAVLRNRSPPFFVLIYGQTSYIEVAAEMRKRLSAQVEIIGTQDLVELGRLAGKISHEDGAIVV
eukprot:TRINITY_DN65081_c0_g1_i1.p1 TRINITY_DN65081_c0_g1~~TRINITY_DN65081_c0_g1_i1.p1  ORF type:complete len:558 (-),score=43.42 TRINITY_DN65081_c0_g1_i1:151-1824(-)